MSSPMSSAITKFVGKLYQIQWLAVIEKKAKSANITTVKTRDAYEPSVRESTHAAMKRWSALLHASKLRRASGGRRQATRTVM